MNIDTYFTVMPKHTNYQPYNKSGNVIFGGVAMAEMDKLAAALTKVILISSPTAEYAVTCHTEMEFMRPVGSGDLIHFNAFLDSERGLGYNKAWITDKHLTGRTLEVIVIGTLIKRNGQQAIFSNAKFTFVTKNGAVYADHNWSSDDWT